MREKLIKLIGMVQDEGRDYSDVVCSYPTSNERLADYLITNGVTIPVLCKDCKHYGYEPYDNGDKCCERWGEWIFPHEDDFCSYGERKDNVE